MLRLLLLVLLKQYDNKSTKVFEMHVLRLAFEPNDITFYIFYNLPLKYPLNYLDTLNQEFRLVLNKKTTQ